MPKGCVPKKIQTCTSATLGGTLSSSLSVTIDRLTFLEFFKTRTMDKMDVNVFHANCRYDGILGRDALSDMGLILDFQEKTMKWDECIVPMRVFPVTKINQEPTPVEQLY